MSTSTTLCLADIAPEKMNLAQVVEAIRELEHKIRHHPCCAAFWYADGKAKLLLPPGDWRYSGCCITQINTSLAGGKVNALRMLVRKMEQIWKLNLQSA